MIVLERNQSNSVLFEFRAGSALSGGRVDLNAVVSGYIDSGFRYSLRSAETAHGKEDRQKAAILDAILTLVVKRGFHDAPMSALAAQVGGESRRYLSTTSPARRIDSRGL